MASPDENGTAPGDSPLSERLREAREGDADALGKLIDASRDYLLLMARRELLDELKAKASASDVVQDTCVRAVERFEQFEGASVEQWLGWLRQILQNQLKDLQRQYLQTELRDVRREKELAAADGVSAGSDTPSRNASRRERAARIQRVMPRLPQKYQTVLKLREWEKLSFHEVGQRLNCSEEAAQKLWYRALDRLNQELLHADRPE